MKRIFAAILSVVLFGSTAFAETNGLPPSVSAASAILVDAESGRVLYEKDVNTRRLIASTTKLMTALVAVESLDDLSGEVTIEPEDTQAEGSSLYLKVGEKLTTETLLYGLLLNSGNDAALALARYCAGDVETFVGWMNQKALSLGMTNTHFENPNGLNNDAHYSTASDMAILGIACMENRTVAKIVATRSITLGTRTFVNHNKLLSQYKGCVGMKTGYTQAAGRTLVSAARQGEQLLICVTLNDPDDWKDHAALFDYGFETFPRQILSRRDKPFRILPVSGSLVPMVGVSTSADVYYPLSGEDRVRAEVQLPASVAAPVEKRETAGMLSFFLGGKKIGETPLVYAATVHRDKIDRISPLDRLLSLLSRGTV